MKRGDKASLVTTTLFVLVIITAGISFYYFFIKEDIDDILNGGFTSYSIISQEETDNGYRIHLYSNDLIDVCGYQIKRKDSILYVNNNIHPMKEEDIKELVDGEIENTNFIEEYSFEPGCVLNDVYISVVKLEKNYKVDDKTVTHTQFIMNKYGNIIYKLLGYYEEKKTEEIPEIFRQGEIQTTGKFHIIGIQEGEEI